MFYSNGTQKSKAPPCPCKDKVLAVGTNPVARHHCLPRHIVKLKPCASHVVQSYGSQHGKHVERRQPRRLCKHNSATNRHRGSFACVPQNSVVEAKSAHRFFSPNLDHFTNCHDRQNLAPLITTSGHTGHLKKLRCPEPSWSHAEHARSMACRGR